jgi:hypothetical protein
MNTEDTKNHAKYEEKNTQRMYDLVIYQVL